MCVTKSKCKFPEKLKNKDPKDCSPKQMQECHPNTKGHPCVGKQK